MGKTIDATVAKDNPAVEPIQRFEPLGELDTEEMELFTRLLIGLSAEGGEMLIERLRVYQSRIDKLAAADSHESGLDDASRTELIRYLAVGSLVRTQRGSVRLAHDTAVRATNSTRSVFGLLDRATDNFLGRPFRRPVESLADRLRTEIGESVVVGHKEMSEGRILARDTTLDIIDDFIAYLSDSPELADLVSDQIGQQSLGVAGAVAEGGRSATLAADNTIEGVIRRIFRRPAREELPKSPFAGKPESVYHPGATSSLPSSSNPTSSPPTSSLPPVEPEIDRSRKG